MKPLERNLLVAALALLPAGGALAEPHGGHHGGHYGGHGPALSLHFGIPLGWYEPYHYYHYPPPYYYYPPAVVQAPAPQAYVQRGDPPGEQAEPAWYYCEESRTYYPYVKACPGGWKRVSPAPPPQ